MVIQAVHIMVNMQLIAFIFKEIIQLKAAISLLFYFFIITGETGRRICHLFIGEIFAAYMKAIDILDDLYPAVSLYIA